MITLAGRRLIGLPNVRLQEISGYDLSPIPDASESDVLRELWRSSGHTQIKLAKLVGISQSTLSSLLSGDREMTKGHMVALGRFFNVSPAVFLPS